jgi:RHH-type transcriptional regulator, proline utilization regulon repressor / proline dehydrogenase / delta 1-pyrroline-5-carboxylate dehydrogenase
VVTPLIRPPGEALRRALTTWMKARNGCCRPRQIGADPCLWSPGIKLGVRRGSWFHRTECFGPVLGLIRAASLDEAIAIKTTTISV